MNITIDMRALSGAYATGVHSYTAPLLEALIASSPETAFSLFSNQWRTLQRVSDLDAHENATSVVRRVPNKALHATLALTGRPRLDRFAGTKPDIWIAPNLHVTALSRDVARIQFVHDLSFLHYPDCFSVKRRLWHRVVRVERACEQATAIVVPSAHTKWDVAETFAIDEARIHVVPPFAEPQAYSMDEAQVVDVLRRYDIHRKYIFAIGTLEPRKNTDVLITAFEESQLAADGYELVIAGAPGWGTRTLMHHIKNTDYVRYLGYVSAAEKEALFRGAIMSCYPSLFEGFGIPILESFAAETPVITSNRSAMAEVAGGAARLVHPENIADMAAALRELAYDPHLRRTLVDAGKERVAEYTKAVSHDRLRAVIDAL